MKSIKEWYSSKDLEGLEGLPTRATNITRKAIKEGWEKREAKGIKGGGFEYHYTSLPDNVQEALGFNKPKLRVIKSTTLYNEALNLPVLQQAIETLEEALEETDREIIPHKKAQLIIAIYDLLLQENNNREPVLKLIKSIV